MGSKNTEINNSDVEASGSGPSDESCRSIAVSQPSTSKASDKPPNENIDVGPTILSSSTEESSKASLKEASLNVNNTIAQASDLVKNINSVKDELCKLPLDPCELEYITIRINPLLNILNQLSNASSNLSVSVNYLTISSVVHPKKSELKDTIHLIYNINEECQQVFKELKHRINKVLED